ncbi:HAD family hydrolase, partial [Mesorhizobium japonicum]
TEAPAPVDGTDLLLFDLDGVVYAGSNAIPHAVDSINSLQGERRVGYLTNNASRTDAAVAEQLRGFGLRVHPDDVVTSPQAAVVLLSERVQAGSRVLVVGGE